MSARYPISTWEKRPVIFSTNFQDSIITLISAKVSSSFRLNDGALLHGTVWRKSAQYDIEFCDNKCLLALRARTLACVPVYVTMERKCACWCTGVE